MAKGKQGLTVEEMRYSVNRFKKQAKTKGENKGWFLDLFWLAYAGKKLYVSPEALYSDLNWQAGGDYCAKHGGELPDVAWLDSLVDRRTGCAALVPGAKAIGLKAGWHWTKQEVAGIPDCARMVDLKGGDVRNFFKDDSGYVRCVRLSQ
jgi:hypothetical protein